MTVPIYISKYNGCVYPFHFLLHGSIDPLQIVQTKGIPLDSVDFPTTTKRLTRVILS